MALKITKEDREFSNLIRARDGWQCQRHVMLKMEGGYHPPPTSALHCAHMFTRRTQATRFEPANAMALCYGCHQYVDSHPAEKEALFRWKFGDEVFELVAATAHGKRDR